MFQKDRLETLSLQYALLSLAEKSQLRNIRELVERVAFLPKHLPDVEVVLTPKQFKIYRECLHIDDFGPFGMESFLSYTGDLKRRLMLEIEKEVKKRGHMPPRTSGAKSTGQPS